MSRYLWTKRTKQTTVLANTTLKSFKLKPSYQPNFWYTPTSKNTAIHQGFIPIIYRNIVEKAKLSQSEFHNAMPSGEQTKEIGDEFLKTLNITNR